jgi:transcriptional regulator with XRE-family HTH domain
MDIITTVMSRQSAPSFPSVVAALRELGQNIRSARMRRQIPAALLAERAGMSRPTLRAIERGDCGVTIGSIANVLHSLDLASDITAMARADEFGRALQDAALAGRKRVSIPKRPSQKATRRRGA